MVAAGLAAGAFFAGPGLSAQDIRGVVVTSATNEAINGAFVLLLDQAGARLAAVLTDSSGRYRLRAPGPGRYRLRVELIGHATQEGPPFALRAGETVIRRIALEPAPIELDEIVATADGRCRLNRDAGRATQRIWDEARKALSITAWAASGDRIAYQAHLYQRSRDIVTGRLIDAGPHLRIQRSGTGRMPFRTASIEDLALRGYVQATPTGEYRYYGLDAESLLSTGFLDLHCFRVVSRGVGDDARVGLAFEPLPDRTRPDVEGVLWLDARTLELQRVEYRFTRHPHAYDVPDESFGGSADFRRLENGAWITDRWQLRIPAYVDVTASPPSVLLHTRPATDSYGRRLRAREAGLFVREEGGELVFSSMLTGAGDGGGIVEGVVYDSTRSRPLVGAVVFATASAHVARTDSLGRFTLRGLSYGEQQIGFFHPYADSLALRTRTETVRVADRARSIQLSMPSSAFCTEEALEGRFTDDGVEYVIPTGGIVGFAEDATSGVPSPGVTVEADWEFRGRWRLADALRGIGPDKVRGASATSGDDGRFLLCHVPIGSDVRIRGGDGPRVAVRLRHTVTTLNVISHR